MSENNPLLAALKLPGRIFQLPSKGMFYKNGELADNIKDGEIHVQSMSALDEINIKNPDQLFSGAAVNTVFKQCIQGIEKPSELLSKDVDAIMIFLRAITYGPSYEFTARHTCDGAKDHSYAADLDVLISKMQMIDPTLVESLYTVNLSNGQVVKLRPNRYQHVLDLIRLNENKKSITVDEQRTNLTLMLLGVIESIDNISDPKLITEWIQKVSTPIINKISEKIETVNSWGPTMKWTCNCKDCKTDFEIEIPINPVSFFTE